MKIKFEVQENLPETEVVIRYRQKDAEVEHITSALNVLNRELVGRKLDQNYVINMASVLYFESVDERVFCYTADDTYEVRYRLYELEEVLKDARFARISISMILNVNAIASFRSSLNGRMEARLKNGEAVEISRNYVPALKAMLGGK